MFFIMVFFLFVCLVFLFVFILFFREYPEAVVLHFFKPLSSLCIALWDNNVHQWHTQKNQPHALYHACITVSILNIKDMTDSKACV